MAVLRGNRQWKIRSLIIDSDIDVTMRLRQTLAVEEHFGPVSYARNPAEASELLRTESPFDIIFLTYRTESSAVLRFLEVARFTPGGSRAGFVLVVQQEGQQRDQLASQLLRGVDAVLFEPYSCVELADAVQIADQVRRGRARARELIAVKLLVPGLVKATGLLAFLSREGFDTELTRRRIKEITDAVASFHADAQDLYFKLLTSRFEIVPTPKQPRRKSYNGASKVVRQRLERLLLRDLERTGQQARRILQAE